EAISSRIRLARSSSQAIVAIIAHSNAIEALVAVSSLRQSACADHVCARRGRSRLRWVSDKTKIVFSGGEELQVDGQPKQVRDRLSRKGARFARLKNTSAANVDV